MEIDGLQQDLPGESSGSEAVVSDKNPSPGDMSVCNTSNNDNLQQTPSRKRNLYADDDSGGDENKASSGDPAQPALKLLHVEEYPAADLTNDPQSALVASQFGELSAGFQINVPRSALGSLHMEENSNREEDPRAVETLSVTSNPPTYGIIYAPSASHGEAIPAGDENNDPLPAVTTPHVEENAGGDENMVTFRTYHRPTFKALHFEENSAVDENNAVIVTDPRSDSTTLHGVENSGDDETRVLVSDLRLPQLDLEASLQVEESSVEDSQAASRRKMLILMPAIAAVFSALAGSLASIGELLVLLQRTGTSVRSESNLLHYYSGLSRSSSSLLDKNNLLVVLFLLIQYGRRSQKRPRELTGPWYIKPRPVQGFESFLDFSPQSDPEKFKELFRISPDLFDHICEMVSEEMLSDTPRSLRVLPNRVLTVQRQVAIAIRRLATGNQFLGIADSFGVSKSTAVKVTWKFIVAFIKKARQQHLRWPRGENMQHVKDGFKTQWGFPNCCGVVDGTHFTVEFPKGEDVTAYYDHQDHVSISMQAIVDQDLRFLDVVVGWPGSVQDYQLMQNTHFFQSVVQGRGRLNGPAYTTQDGSFLREYVIGDGGYPLYDWLIVPYPGGLSAAKDEWNSRHAQARICADNALRRLKGTWRILSRILWKPRKERIGRMVFACCLLHNMIIERQDGLNPQTYAGVNPHPGGYSGISIPTTDVFEGGTQARDVLFREVMGRGII